jgi:RNA polymerase primary sigma factor
VAIVQALTKPAQKADRRRSSNVDTIGTYLQEIGRYPLLTHEQELEYGSQIQAWMNAKEKWDQIDIEQQRRLERDGQRAMKIMQRSNLRLVVAIAKKYRHSNVDFMDLVQEGSIGLKTAAEKFDPTTGNKFSTYAYWWIRQAIIRTIANQSRTIRFPVHIVEKTNEIRRCVEDLTKQGKQPTRSRVLELLKERSDFAPEVYERILDNPTYRSAMSLSTPVGSRFGDTDELGIFLSSGDDLMERAIEQEMIEFGRSMLETSNLTENEKFVIRLRFGIDGSPTHTLEEIGKILNKSRERIRQIQTRALYKLRKLADRQRYRSPFH